MIANIKSVVLIATLALPGVVAAQTPPPAALLTTKHFAFYSDLATNVNDALVTAASARLQKRPEPFASGPETTCIDGLAMPERAAWERAVTYYTESKSTGFQRVLLRLKLAGYAQRYGMDDAANLKYLEEIAAIREAATPAYQKCRWPAQDALNRQWIDRVKPLLDRHEIALGEQLPRLFQKPWEGLPFRVDVVQFGGFSGANSAGPDYPALHIYISSTNTANQDRAALEVAFHEAVHFVAGPDTPLGVALASAIKESGITPPRMDLVHAVHFFVSGEAVRRAFAQDGGPPYTPYLYAQKLFPDQFRESAARLWPAYMDGTRTLAQAASDQVRALMPNETPK